METLRIADRYRPKVERLVLAALRTMADVPDGWADLLRAGDLEAALARIDRSGLQALAPRFVSKAKSPDGDNLDDLLGNAAIESAASPPATLGLDATFEIVNARAVQWAQDRAAQLVVQVDNETRRAIRDVVARVITEGGGTRAIAREVRALVGLTSAQARSLARYADTVAGKRTSSKLVARRADRLLRYRARNIARTETMRASNVGLRLQWDDLASRGLIDRKYAVRVWQVTPDDRLCDLCAPMAGQTVGYDAPFVASERGVRADDRKPLPSPLSTTEPPLHPQCRCTMGLDYRFD